MNLLNSRVLIVDDQPANVHTLTEALGNEHEVMVAGTGERALELAPSADLVLLAARLPDLDGLEVCRRLKADQATRRIPVIFVHPVDQAGSGTQGLEAGAADCIERPITPALVRARVRAHLELKAARDLLEHMATQDDLTGIANRRRFDEAAREEWRRSMRFSQVLTVVLADIDQVEAMNDRHARDGGDHGLRRVAEALQRLCRRPGELAARYGGEQFVLLLPGTDLEGARRFVARVLDTVAAVEVEGLAAPGPLGVSAGAVTLIPSPLNSLEDALRDAGHGLHKAKEAGRGRGIVHDQETGQISEVGPGS
jgi:diguanylate cyclase (GGDEF)-like protein